MVASLSGRDHGVLGAGQVRAVMLDRSTTVQPYMLPALAARCEFLDLHVRRRVGASHETVEDEQVSASRRRDPAEESRRQGALARAGDRSRRIELLPPPRGRETEGGRWLSCARGSRRNVTYQRVPRAGRARSRAGAQTWSCAAGPHEEEDTPGDKPAPEDSSSPSIPSEALLPCVIRGRILGAAGPRRLCKGLLPVVRADGRGSCSSGATGLWLRRRRMFKHPTNRRRHAK